MGDINWGDIGISIINWLNDYGYLAGLIGAAFTALGALLKKLWNKTGGAHYKGKIKKETAELVVQYVEQVYKDLHGPEKFKKAIEAATDMLADKGINITELELRVYIEAALASFNNAFKKTKAAPISWKGEEVETLDPEKEIKAIEALTDEELNGAEVAG